MNNSEISAKKGRGRPQKDNKKWNREMYSAYAKDQAMKKRYCDVCKIELSYYAFNKHHNTQKHQHYLALLQNQT